MNPFRFIADMLHLLSFVVLIAKIKNTRNCLGLNCQFFKIYRTIIPYIGDLSGGVSDQILGFVLVLHFTVQQYNEIAVHSVNMLHNLLDEVP